MDYKIDLKIDKKTKTASIQTNFDFHFFECKKYHIYFHLDFVINPLEKVGRALFFKEFGGRSRYPNEVEEILYLDEINKRSIIVKFK